MFLVDDAALIVLLGGVFKVDSRGQPFTSRLGWLQRRHSANPDVIGVVPAL